MNGGLPPPAENLVDAAPPEPDVPHMTQLTERLDRFESRLHGMESELRELRRLAAREERDVAPEPPLREVLSPEQEPEPEPVRRPAPAPVRKRREPLDWSVLFGARALAWTGGAVTLLGIVFFFVLAVERGWIGEAARVLLGAAASALCIGAGVWLRRRFGDTYASLSAAGAGIAGLYATLLAATALYDLVPRPVALVAAAAIAGVGTALAIRWRSQTLASLGLLGANLVPLPIAIQDDHLSAIGTAFAALVFAGGIVATVPRRWRVLLAASFATTLVEALALVAVHAQGATSVAVAVWLIASGGALRLALRDRLTYLPASLLVLSASYAGWGAAILYDGRTLGVALLVIAGAFAAGSGAFFTRDRNSASLLWAIALTVAAVAAAALTSGATLTIVWAAEAAVLAWLARRIVEPRFQLAALGWLTLAYGHALLVDAPLTKLFVASDSTWVAAAGAAALAVATGLVAVFAFDWEPLDEGILAPVVDALQTAQPAVRQGGAAVAGAAALYSASLAVVTVPASWDWGHVAVVGLWSLVPVALVASRFQRASLAVVGGASALAGTYDLLVLDDTPRAWAWAIVAAALIVVAVVRELRAESSPLLQLVMLAGSALFACGAVVQLLDGDARGGALLVLAAGYGAIGVGLLTRRRDFASGCGVVGLAVAVLAAAILLSGTWLVLALAATAATLALLARFEERLVVGAVGYLALALGHALAFEARPDHLFVAHRHPAGGVLAVVLVLLPIAAVAYVTRLRRTFAWLGGALALYAASLVILEAFEDSGGGVAAAFQRGHSGVSALWGTVGLALLVAGLRRGARDLRTGGLALFAASLAKLFLYDLANLSSITRALSFLAVGAVLLVGGFFYQRLTMTNGTDLHSPA